MRLLLDTQIALWAVVNSPRLSPMARELILSAENSVWVSAASVWEIAIKHAVSGGDMPVTGARANELFALSGYLPRRLTQGMQPRWRGCRSRAFMPIRLTGC